jgi:hypothetical protein
VQIRILEQGFRPAFSFGDEIKAGGLKGFETAPDALK